MADAVAPKTDLQPAPGGLLDFAKFLTGTKTSGSENVSGTQATQGQTGPLEAILAQLSDPNGLTNLVNGLFAKGALQVPALTAQYANATGTRTSNNAMLGQSLAQLNQSLASSIAEAVVNQQKVAADAAAKLGDINKSTATTKAGTTTAAQKPNDLKTGIATGAGTVLGGTLINTLAKKFNLGGASKSTDGAESTVPALPSSIGTNDFLPTTDVPVVGLGDAAPLSAADGGLPAPLSGADLEPIPIPESDGTGTDVAPDPSVDVSSDVAPDVDATPDDLSFWDDMSDFFANGGIVLAHSGSMKGKKSAGSGTGGKAAASKSSYADGGEIENYADGGVIDSSTPVRRNAINYGTSQPVQSAAALNIQPTASSSASSASVAPRTTAASSKGAAQGVDASGSPFANELSPTLDTFDMRQIEERQLSDLDNEPQYQPSIGPVGIANAALSFARTPTLAALGPIGAGLAIGSLASPIARFIADALGGKNAVNTDLGQQVELDRQTQEFSNNPGEDHGAPPTDNPGWEWVDGSWNFNSSRSPENTDFPAPNSDQNTSEGSDPVPPSNEGEADGGLQDAANIKEASGIDKKTIHVTPGEYVLPVDVTQTLGVDMLDELVAHLHTPIGTKNVTESMKQGRD